MTHSENIHLHHQKLLIGSPQFNFFPFPTQPIRFYQLNSRGKDH